MQGLILSSHIAKAVFITQTKQSYHSVKTTLLLRRGTTRGYRLLFLRTQQQAEKEFWSTYASSNSTSHQIIYPSLHTDADARGIPGKSSLQTPSQCRTEKRGVYTCSVGLGFIILSTPVAPGNSQPLRVVAEGETYGTYLIPASSSCCRISSGSCRNHTVSNAYQTPFQTSSSRFPSHSSSSTEATHHPNHLHRINARHVLV